MAEPPDSGNTGEGAPTALEGGAYDLIKQRLNDQGATLREELGKLDERRAQVFGSKKLELKKMARVSTQLNCEPRDMIQLGHDHFLFGFNVELGLKQGQLSDVFAVYDYDETAEEFNEGDLSILHDAKFQERFGVMFSVNKDARFHRFAQVGSNFYMVFRTGSKVGDVTVYKWLINADGQLVYENDRAANEYLNTAFPAEFNFQWINPTPSDVRHGDNPHVSIQDRVFVECVGGDLTIKIEDNTATGDGIYSEPVEDRNQKLDDA